MDRSCTGRALQKQFHENCASARHGVRTRRFDEGDVNEFKYLIPSCVDEAIALRQRHGQRARFIAGGTEIVPMMTRHRLEPECLIELSRLDGLAVLARHNGSLRIGAMATHATLERSPLTQGAWRALAEASGSVREPQVRNLGTVGGNLAFGVPSADLLPPLLAFDASVKIKGQAGERLVPISKFVIAPYRTNLNEDDIILEIQLPEACDGSGSAFCKLTKFRGFGLSVASVAAALTLRDGRISASAHRHRCRCANRPPCPRCRAASWKARFRRRMCSGKREGWYLPRPHRVRDRSARRPPISAKCWWP